MLDAGIRVDYVLIDTWFTTEPMLLKLLETGMGAIGMVKQLKQRYTYRDKTYTLPQLHRFVRFKGARNIFGSIVVETKTGIPVKIAIVQNRNKKSECLYLLEKLSHLQYAPKFVLLIKKVQRHSPRHNSPKYLNP